MPLLRWVLPRSVAAQITGLLVVAVLLGVGLTSGVVIFFSRASNTAWNMETVAAARAARVAAVVRGAEASHSGDELAAIIGAARRARMDVTVLSSDRVAAAQHGEWRSPGIDRSIVAELEHTWRIFPVKQTDASGAESMVIDIGAGRALAFRVGSLLARPVIAAGAILVIAVITFGILLLSIYAVRWVTSPLSTIASAARAFGREPSVREYLRENGPREIAQVAEALNEARRRIAALVEERTRMLLAISHDLRTPLTRLLLRAERVPNRALREGMLHDIVAVTDMLSETLSFLREGASSEPRRRVDLPSLLRTMCAEFSDVGHDVTYEGPARLAITCRDRALGRAVTNVVDNATKHGKIVSVTLRILTGQMLQIEVSDDGPGIAPELRERVLEPFFKIDTARQRAGRAGVGLGLSIARDIVRAHGGDIVVVGNDRGGVTVQLMLAVDREEISASTQTKVMTPAA